MQFECLTPFSAGALSASDFPPDAQAIIYKPSRSAMTSGKARTRQWKLCFEPRSVPFAEPLMGWTASADPLSQVELTFPTLDSAIAYARRQGLRYAVCGAPRRNPQLRLVSVRAKPAHVQQAQQHALAA